MNYENKTAFVTKKLVEENFKIGFAYREKPDNETDSGWRFFAGNESQEYVDNADNLTILPVKSIIEKDMSIVSIINSEYGTAFEKGNTEFKKIDDFTPGSD